MREKSWIKPVRGVLGAALVSGIAIAAMTHHADAQDRVRWRVPIAFPSALPVLGDTMPWVAEHLATASDGRIELRPVEPGELVPALEITEAVGSGQVQAGYTWVGYDQGRIPSTPLFGAVPFGMEPWEYSAWWYYAGGRELGEEILGAHGVHPIYCGITGPETAGWFKSEIVSLDDINGLKIRFAGLGGRVLQALGASVTMIAGGEIFQALERGAIDASEFSLPIVDQRLGFHQVASFNYYPGWHQPFTAFHLVVNAEEWAGLSEADQTLIDMACMAGVIRSIAASEAWQGEIIRGFPDIGVTAVRLPDEILRELQQVTAQVLAEEAANDADFARVYESQREFMQNYQVWKELAYLPRDFGTIADVEAE